MSYTCLKTTRYLLICCHIVSDLENSKSTKIYFKGYVCIHSLNQLNNQGFLPLLSYQSPSDKSMYCEAQSYSNLIQPDSPPPVPFEYFLHSPSSWPTDHATNTPMNRSFQPMSSCPPDIHSAEKEKVHVVTTYNYIYNYRQELNVCFMENIN